MLKPSIGQIYPIFVGPFDIDEPVAVPKELNGRSRKFVFYANRYYLAHIQMQTFSLLYTVEPMSSTPYAIV